MLHDSTLGRMRAGDFFILLDGTPATMVRERILLNWSRAHALEGGMVATGRPVHPNDANDPVVKIVIGEVEVAHGG